VECRQGIGSVPAASRSQESQGTCERRGDQERCRARGRRRQRCLAAPSPARGHFTFFEFRHETITVRIRCPTGCNRSGHVDSTCPSLYDCAVARDRAIRFLCILPQDPARHVSNRKSDSRSQPDPIADLELFLTGDPGAIDRLARQLGLHASTAASAMLGRDHPDVDDVAQESALAVLEHIRRRRGFEGDLVAFTVTVARNRCRTLIAWQRLRPQLPLEPLSEWIAHPGKSPLDALLDGEVTRLLQEAIDRLDEGCRDLLRDFYFEDVSMEEIRRRVGLNTVQGVYYRRSICLGRVESFLKRHLFRRSSSDTEERGA